MAPNDAAPTPAMDCSLGDRPAPAPLLPPPLLLLCSAELAEAAVGAGEGTASSLNTSIAAVWHCTGMGKAGTAEQVGKHGMPVNPYCTWCSLPTQHAHQWQRELHVHPTWNPKARMGRATHSSCGPPTAACSDCQG